MAKRKKKTFKKVIHLNADTSGCFYDRVKTPSDSINAARQGWQSRYQMENISWDLLKGFDLVVGQRVSTVSMFNLWKHVLLPFFPAAAYEVDDNLFEVEPTNHQAYGFFSSPDVKKNMADAMWASDALIVSCRPLAEELVKFNRHIFILPNYLPGRHLRPPKRHDRDPIIGWGGGSSHYHDFQEASGALSRVIAQNPNILLRLYGMDYSHLVQAENTELFDWFSSKDDYLVNLDLDIGICPLRDSAFNRCKTAVKALEYSFKGIPTIASNVTPYKEFVVHGETGYLANDEDEWEFYLNELLHKPELRYELGSNAYEFAKNHRAEDHVEERLEVYDLITQRSEEIKSAKRNHLRELEGAKQELQLPNKPA